MIERNWLISELERIIQQCESLSNKIEKRLGGLTV